LPLDETQKVQFEKLMASEPYQGVKAMNQTWFEKGIEKERREFLLELLQEQFGPLASPVLTKLQQMPMDQLGTLRKAILHANSLQELGLE
jgi:hypothetical protein